MKLKLGLVPGFFIRALAVPFMLGEAKYARGDWAKQDDPEKFIQDRKDSAMRHWTDYCDNLVYDEDGQNNAAAAAWNILVVLFYEYFRIPSGEKLFNDTYLKKLEEYRATKLPKPAPGKANEYLKTKPSVEELNKHTIKEVENFNLAAYLPDPDYCRVCKGPCLLEPPKH